MKSAFRTTLLMLIIALAATATAAYYYPWPEIELTRDLIDTPLFEEFDLDQVRSIEIVKFNDDRNELETIRIRRKADKWIFPDKGNFVATGAPLIAAVRGSLNERKIREFMSDQEEDHIKYGVVDPLRNASAVRSSLGTKLTLEDRQGKVIANLIVGKGVKSESEVPQRFVRIPEQPNVYVIDYDERILTTNFSQWVDSNILQLATRANPAGQQGVEVNIDKYRYDPKEIADPDARESIYRARFKYSEEIRQLGFDSLEIPTPVIGKWQKITPNQTQQPELAQWTRVVAQIQVANVARKSKNLIAVLRNPKEDASEETLSELNNFGFHKTGFENGAFQFDGAGGEFSMTSREGVRFNLYIGAFDDGTTKTTSGNLTRYLMITVDVNYSMFPEPEKPEDPEDKAYLRALETRKTNLAKARKTASDLNRVQADWFYIVDDEILSMLVPTLSFDAAATPAQPKDEVEGNKPAAEESTSTDDE